MNNRNYGIDFLRLVAMFLVVTLHVLGRGGVLSNASGSQYAVSWLIEIGAYCAVNCYALISGYVCYREQKHPIRYSTYLSFWVPVVFYSFGITLIGYFINPSGVGITDIIKSAIPVTSSQYWYVSAYTGLFFLIPWLNKSIQSLDQKSFNQLILVLFLVFSCFATPANAISDVFQLTGGYSVIWLVLMYLVGAWLKKNEITTKLSSIIWISIALACVLFTWGFKIFAPYFNSVLIGYTSPTVVLVAISLVSIFSRLRLPSHLVYTIRLFSPAAFGVYLIHTQWFIWDNCIRDTFSWIATIQPYLIPIVVCMCSFGIFVSCLLVERLRLTLFSVLKINSLIEKIQGYVDHMSKRLVRRLNF